MRFSNTVCVWPSGANVHFRPAESRRTRDFRTTAQLSSEFCQPTQGPPLSGPLPHCFRASPAADDPERRREANWFWPGRSSAGAPGWAVPLSGRRPHFA